MKVTSMFLRTALAACLVALLVAPASAGTRFGGGVHYLKALGDIKDDPAIDENSFGFLGSVAFAGDPLRFEVDLEVVPDYVGSGETLWQPQGYLLVGGLIYGGAGAGIGNLTGFGWQDPFLALRAGVDFMAGSLDLDIFASYRFQKAKDLETLTTDSLNSLTFGALVRFGGK